MEFASASSLKFSRITRSQSADNLEELRKSSESVIRLSESGGKMAVSHLHLSAVASAFGSGNGLISEEELGAVEEKPQSIREAFGFERVAGDESAPLAPEQLAEGQALLDRTFTRSEVASAKAGEGNFILVALKTAFYFITQGGALLKQARADQETLRNPPTNLTIAIGYLAQINSTQESGFSLQEIMADGGDDLLGSKSYLGSGASFMRAMRTLPEGREYLSMQQAVIEWVGAIENLTNQEGVTFNAQQQLVALAAQNVVDQEFLGDAKEKERTYIADQASSLWITSAPEDGRSYAITKYAEKLAREFNPKGDLAKFKQTVAAQAAIFENAALTNNSPSVKLEDQIWDALKANPTFTKKLEDSRDVIHVEIAKLRDFSGTADAIGGTVRQWIDAISTINKGTQEGETFFTYQVVGSPLYKEMPREVLDLVGVAGNVKNSIETIPALELLKRILPANLQPIVAEGESLPPISTRKQLKQILTMNEVDEAFAKAISDHFDPASQNVNMQKVLTQMGQNPEGTVPVSRLLASLLPTVEGLPTHVSSAFDLGQLLTSNGVSDALSLLIEENFDVETQTVNVMKPFTERITAGMRGTSNESDAALFKRWVGYMHPETGMMALYEKTIPYLRNPDLPALAAKAYNKGAQEALVVAQKAKLEDLAGLARRGSSEDYAAKFAMPTRVLEVSDARLNSRHNLEATHYFNMLSSALGLGRTEGSATITHELGEFLAHDAISFLVGSGRTTPKEFNAFLGSNEALRNLVEQLSKDFAQLTDLTEVGSASVPLGPQMITVGDHEVALRQFNPAKLAAFKTKLLGVQAAFEKAKATAKQHSAKVEKLEANSYLADFRTLSEALNMGDDAAAIAAINTFIDKRGHERAVAALVSRQTLTVSEYAGLIEAVDINTMSLIENIGVQLTLLSSPNTALQALEALRNYLNENSYSVDFGTLNAALGMADVDAIAAINAFTDEHGVDRTTAALISGQQLTPSKYAALTSNPASPLAVLRDEISVRLENLATEGYLAQLKAIMGRMEEIVTNQLAAETLPREPVPVPGSSSSAGDRAADFADGVVV